MNQEIVRWTEEIADHIKEQFNLTVNHALPIDKGWLNVKWKMETDRGPVFVKFYHPKRYKLHMRPERKTAIQRTLQLQHTMSLAEIKCPKVYPAKGELIQQTSSGAYYTVLEWVDGYTQTAGYLDNNQMYDLGVQTGKMHRWLRNVKPGFKGWQLAA